MYVVCMYVCLSVRNRLTIETFLGRDAHDAIAMVVEDSEDRRRRQIKSRELNSTNNKRMKDKITVTGDDLRVSTRAIYFAR